MRRLMASFLLAVALSWAGAPYGNQNARKSGAYSRHTTRPGRARAIYAKRTTSSGSSYKRLGTRSRTSSKVIVMSRRSR